MQDAQDRKLHRFRPEINVDSSVIHSSFTERLAQVNWNLQFYILYIQFTYI